MQNQAVTKVEVEKLEIREIFKNLLPPLSKSARTQLRRSIIRNGVIEPICYRVKDGVKEIIDGHNRYEIALELEVPFKTQEMKFACPENEAVFYWIYEKQAGRRDGKYYEAEMEVCLSVIHKWQGKVTTQAERIRIISSVTGKSVGATKKQVQRGNGNVQPKPSPVELLIKQIQKALAQLTDEDKEKIRQILK